MNVMRICVPETAVTWTDSPRLFNALWIVPVIADALPLYWIGLVSRCPTAR